LLITQERLYFKTDEMHTPELRPAGAYDSETGFVSLRVFVPWWQVPSFQQPVDLFDWCALKYKVLFGR